MNSFQSILLIIFGVIAYMMIVDRNVADYLNLVFKMMKLNIERTYWMIRFHPRNPIVNWMKRLEYERIAKELEKEFSK